MTPDVEEFLARPLVARVATSGPTVRPVWFLWEDGAFWWITGDYSALPRRLARDPALALVVDVCDLQTGAIAQVRARGDAEVVALDLDRARRTLARYLGADPAGWPARFHRVLTKPDTRLVRMVPRSPLRLKDHSFETG